MGENRKKLARFAAAVLCMVFLYPVSSHAQPDTACSHGSHEYVSDVLTPASEEEPGQVQNTCIYCGDTYIEQLPATGHVFGPWETEEKDGISIERRICSQCGRQEERPAALAAETPPIEKEPDTAWKANSMDYVLATATGGVWGYAALVLWWNSLVLIWYKRECRRKKEKRHDVE